MTIEYPLTLSYPLSDLRSRLHCEYGIDLECEYRAAMVEEFMVADPLLNKDYVRGHVLAGWRNWNTSDEDQVTVVIESRTSALSELPHDVLVGALAALLNK